MAEVKKHLEVRLVFHFRVSGFDIDCRGFIVGISGSPRRFGVCGATLFAICLTQVRHGSGNLLHCKPWHLWNQPAGMVLWRYHCRSRIQGCPSMGDPKLNLDTTIHNPSSKTCAASISNTPDVRWVPCPLLLHLCSCEKRRGFPTKLRATSGVPARSGGTGGWREWVHAQGGQHLEHRLCCSISEALLVEHDKLLQNSAEELVIL